MFWVYIIQNEAGRFYVGHTEDLRQRVHHHNTGQSHYTVGKGPWTLVYSEEHPTRGEAMRRESQIKGWKSRKMIQQLIDGQR